MSNRFKAATAAQAQRASVAGVKPGTRRTVTAASISEAAAERGAAILRDAHGAAIDAHYRRGDAEMIATLKRRLAAVRAAHGAMSGEMMTADVRRADRLDALAFLIGSRLSTLTGGHRPVLASEIGAHGMFVRYVRANYRHVKPTPDLSHHTRGEDGETVGYRAPGLRSDLGLLAYGPEDILGDALALALRWADMDREAYEAGTADDRQSASVETALAFPSHVGGVAALPISRGTLYLAIRHAWRVGLGTAGAMLRGKTVDWIDGVPVARESDTVTWAREAAQEAHLRITVAARAYTDTEPAPRDAVNPALATVEISDLTPEEVRTGEARARAERALATSWPLTHDASLPTVARMLLEGYTVEQIAAEFEAATGKTLTPATLTRWARQMGAFLRAA